jgi:hypothetical protein
MRQATKPAVKATKRQTWSRLTILKREQPTMRREEKKKKKNLRKSRLLKRTFPKQHNQEGIDENN